MKNAIVKSRAAVNEYRVIGMSLASGGGFAVSVALRVRASGVLRLKERPLAAWHRIAREGVCASKAWRAGGEWRGRLIWRAGMPRRPMTVFRAPYANVRT